MLLPRLALIAAPLLVSACDAMLLPPQPSAPPAIAPQGQIAPAAPTEIAPIVPTAPTFAIEDPAPGAAEATEPQLGFVRPYRSDDDPCRLVAESDFTLPFLSDAADLVACPRNGAAWQTLAADRAAQPVAQTSLYTLWSVPRR